MRHATYGTDPSTASIAILVKETSFNSQEIKEHYIDQLGANPAAFIAMSLWYDDNGKAPAALAKDYLQTLLLSLKQLGITTLLVTDSLYFKYITESKHSALSQIGHHNISKIAPYASAFDVWYAPNFHAAQYNPKTSSDLIEALRGFKSHLTDSYEKPGNSVIRLAEYPLSIKEISDALDKLLDKPAITVDIETKGLEFWNCGIATIAFAWDKHNFVAFPVDRGKHPNEVKKLLQNFFIDYRGKSIYHNGSYDMKVLTYELFMKGVSHEDLQEMQKRAANK